MNEIIEFFKKHRKLTSRLLTALVLVLMAIYLNKNRLVFNSLKNLNVRYLLPIVLSQILTVAVTALLNKKIIMTLHTDIPYKDAFHLQYANNFLNKLFSEGGALFRGYYLKKKHGLPYSKYISTIAGLYILSFLSYSIVGALSLIYIYFTKGKINWWILLFFSGLFVGTILLILINPRFSNKKDHWIFHRINDVLVGWEEIKKNKADLLLFTFFTILLLVLHTPQIIFLYRALGQDIGFVESLYMSCAGIITTFINITPDGVGIKEGVYMFSADIIGLDTEVVLLGTLVSRAVALITSFVLGGLSYFLISSKLRNELNTTE